MYNYDDEYIENRLKNAQRDAADLSQKLQEMDKFWDEVADLMLSDEHKAPSRELYHFVFRHKEAKELRERIEAARARNWKPAA